MAFVDDGIDRPMTTAFTNHQDLGPSSTATLLFRQKCWRVPTLHHCRGEIQELQTLAAMPSTATVVEKRELAATDVPWPWDVTFTHWSSWPVRVTNQWHLTTPFPWHSRACLSLSFSTCNPTFKCGDLLMQNHSRLIKSPKYPPAKLDVFQKEYGYQADRFPYNRTSKVRLGGAGVTWQTQLQTIVAQLWRS